MKPFATARVPRSASVLVLTLVVVALLTLGAMAYFERMFAERRASRASGRQLQSRHLAESGVEYVRALLMQDPKLLLETGGLYANPNLFQGILVTDDPLAAFRGRFTVLAPDMTTDGYYGGIRFGLENESSRLNLNTVLLADSTQDGARKVLMTLPGMTESIADAILDWIDPDGESRLLGAEQDYYSSRNPPYAPRNGPIGSIEELLLVREVTPALLFGADLNRNAAIEQSEEPLMEIDNVDNSTGLLNRGWAAYLTLESAEANLRPDGQPKIDVNMDDLQALHKQLVEVLDEEMANFIIAYRQGGPRDEDDQDSTGGQSASEITLDFTQPGRQRLTTILDLIGVDTEIARTPAGGQGDQNQGGGDGDDGDGGGRGGGEGRGDGEGRGNEDGEGRGGGEGQNPNSRIGVKAAFLNERGAMQRYLPKLMDNLAVNAAPTIPGRININQAPRRLLSGVPGLTSTAVDQIIANRDITLGQQRPEQVHETWLLTDGIVELDEMKKLMALVTTGGNVYRAQVVGFFDEEGPADRLEVLIDATQSPPVVRRRWELRELGPGYSREVLGVPVADTL
jgi:type II secretory pathway component PulK